MRSHHAGRDALRRGAPHLTAVAFLVSALALMAAMLTGARGDAASANEVLVTPEGTRIEVYTSRVGGQTVQDVLLANGLNSEIGPYLTVKIGDEFSNYTSWSLGSGGSFAAVIHLNTDGFLSYPNATLGHEYGHVYGHFYRGKVWGGSWASYLQARGLEGDPRLETSYAWRVSEIFAEDYRQLLAAPEAWSEGPYPLNRDIPLATEVPGLEDFLCSTWQGQPWDSDGSCVAPSPEPTQTSAPEPTPSPTPTATPTSTDTPTSEPSPTPTSAPDGPQLTVTVSEKGWRSFSAPASGQVDPEVFEHRAKSPTRSVAKGRTYWVKGPAQVTITTQ